MNTERSAFHCTALSLLLLGFSTFAAEQTRRTLTVTGTGEVTAAPDRVVIRLGASAQAEEAVAAQTNINEVMHKAINKIEEAGVARRSIRTSGLTLTPIYSSQKSVRPDEPRIVGYRASNTIEVTMEDTQLVGKVIDAGLRAGANRLEGVSFGLQNDLFQRRSALQEAVEEARAKAQTIARALDVPLGSVREVVEGGVHVLQPERFAAARGMVAADAIQTPVEPGEVRVQASVTIHYDIESTK